MSDGHRRRQAAPRPPVDSVERALAQVGDAWSFMILREAFFGVRRFDEFSKTLGAAPNILAARLKRLVGFGLLGKVQYRSRPVRFEYRLTEKGLDLYPMIVALMRWGDRWLDDGEGPPLDLVHRRCGAHAKPALTCDVCGEPIRAREMSWRAHQPTADHPGFSGMSGEPASAAVVKR